MYVSERGAPSEVSISMSFFFVRPALVMGVMCDNIIIVTIDVTSCSYWS